MFARNKILTLAITGTLLLSCKTNQKINGKQHGIWITKTPLENNNKKIYKSKEFYKMGMPVKTWKYFIDGKLTRKEKYNKDLSAWVTFYQENGKKEKKGKTKIQISEKEAHWFYEGPWVIFNKKGEPIKTVHYHLGVAMKTDTIIPKK